MTTSTSKRPTGQKDKKIKSEKDKNVTKVYVGKIARSIRRTLTYMKNLKVHPTVHKKLKTEAAEREVNIYDLTAAAITVGLDARHKKELDRVLTQLEEVHTSQAGEPPKAG